MVEAFDFWEMIEKQKQHPCTFCENGRGTISQYVDKDTGRLMQVSESCSETCLLLRAGGEQK